MLKAPGFRSRTFQRDQYNSRGGMLETIGHYKVLDRIGSGGIGDVFRARDTKVGRTVALKVVAPDITADPEKRARFLSDTQRLTALTHPNIATVYEVAEDHGVVYLALEFVPGEPLRRLIAGGGLNARRAIEYAIQMADALAEAHAVGITHQDLTTANVVITPKGSVKILEFGLASWTRSGRLRGSHDDVFSLGAVVFEMITGKPFDARVSAAARPATVGREVPHELDPIVARMLLQDGQAPYESPATVAADLRAAAEAIDRRTASVEQPLPMPARRQRGAGLQWLIVLVVLVAVALVWLVMRR
jgi:serine/threonine protein kinase